MVWFSGARTRGWAFLGTCRTRRSHACHRARAWDDVGHGAPPSLGTQPYPTRTARPGPSAVSSNVLLYDRDRLLAADAGAVRGELARALLRGPGVLVVRGAFERELILRVTAVFDALLEEQARAAPTRARGGPCRVARPHSHTLCSTLKREPMPRVTAVFDALLEEQELRRELYPCAPLRGLARARGVGSYFALLSARAAGCDLARCSLWLVPIALGARAAHTCARGDPQRAGA